MELLFQVFHVMSCCWLPVNIINVEGQHDMEYKMRMLSTPKFNKKEVDNMLISPIHFLRLLFLDPYNTDVVNNSFLDPGTKQP